MSRKSAAPAGRKWLRPVFIGLVLAFVVPVIQVGCVRVVDPPATPLMFLRQAEARLAGKPVPPRRYEWLSLARLPRYFLRCLIASEDQRFLQHDGFDWKEIDAARHKAERTGRPVRGASTITMQCARSLFLWQGRSWVRKGLEAYYTFWMEALLPKRRVLELYANVIEMGDGVYGAQAAAQAHFGTTAAALKREQCALIVACLPNPRVRNPAQPSAAVRARAERIQREEATLRLPADFLPGS